MFARQPREVYRVYGEDDFFAEQDGEGAYPESQQAPVQEHRPELHEPVIADPSPQQYAPAPEYPTEDYSALEQTPPPSRSKRPAPAPAVYEPVAETQPRPRSQGRQPRPPRTDAERDRRRTAALIALAAVLGLLLVIVLVGHLGSSGSSNGAHQALAPAPERVLTQTPVKPQPMLKRAPTHHPRRAPAPRHYRSTHTYTTHVSRVVVREVIAAPQPHLTQAPVSPPVVTVSSAPAPSYAPPSPPTGMEFGFEH